MRSNIVTRVSTSMNANVSITDIQNNTGDTVRMTIEPTYTPEVGSSHDPDCNVVFTFALNGAPVHGDLKLNGWFHKFDGTRILVLDNVSADTQMFLSDKVECRITPYPTHNRVRALMVSAVQYCEYMLSDKRGYTLSAMLLSASLSRSASGDVRYMFPYYGTPSNIVVDPETSLMLPVDISEKLISSYLGYSGALMQARESFQVIYTQESQDGADAAHTLANAGYGQFCDCCCEVFIFPGDARSHDNRDGLICEECYYDAVSEEDFEDDYDDDDDCLRSYHTNVLEECESFLTEDNETDPVFLGVELEVQAKIKRREAYRKVMDCMSDYVIIKSDGSLDSSKGMEIVSIPATLGVHQKKVWRGFFESKPHQYLSGWDGYNCGMHVHVGRGCMSDMELGKLMVFINHRQNSTFITRIAGRASGSYCARAYSTRIVDGKKRTTDHYDAVSLSAHTQGMTAEIRIFRSNVNEIGFFKNIEFCDAAVRFCKEASFLELNQASFIRFVMRPENRSKYQHLIEYLKRSGFVTDKHKTKVSEITNEEG